MKKSLRDKKDVKFLFRFLKSKGLFIKYMKELFKQKNEEAVERLFEKRHGTESFAEIIDYSFCWSETEDGHDFWSKINKEFSKHFLKYFNGRKYPESFDYLFKDLVIESSDPIFSSVSDYDYDYYFA